MRVKVLRAFCIAGLRQEVGSIINVPDSIGREVLQMRKAEQVAGVPAAEVVGVPAAAPAEQSTPAQAAIPKRTIRKEK